MPFTADELSTYIIRHFTPEYHSPSSAHGAKPADSETQVKDDKAKKETLDEHIADDDDYPFEESESEFMESVSTGYKYHKLHEYYEDPSLITATAVHVAVAYQMIFFESVGQIYSPRDFIFNKYFLSKGISQEEKEEICRACETPDEIWLQALEKARPQLTEILKKNGSDITEYLNDIRIQEEIEAAHTAGISPHIGPGGPSIFIDQKYDKRPN